MISVLLSAYNESTNPFFWKTLDLISELKVSGLDIEVLVGATCGNDNTLELLKKKNIKTKIIETSQRATRYNLIFKESSSGPDDWIVLNHPRSLLDKDAFLSLLTLHSDIQWGGFTHQFDWQPRLLQFTSWWSNHVRGDIKKIFYLDHCLFVRRGLFEKVGGFPEVEIFEDTLLSQKLLSFSEPLRLSYKSTTSAIRFQKRGLWQQSLLNQILKLRFHLGKSDVVMNELYEKKMNLNS